MQALGNDFILIDLDDNIDINNKLFTKDFIQKISNRKFGIGADQVLLIKNLNEYRYQYQIFNNNGNEVANCGNGARCIIKYLSNKHEYHNKQLITLHTLTKTLIGYYDITSNTVSIDMGIAKFTPESIAFNYHQYGHYQHQSYNHHILRLLDDTIINFAIVDIGNPHIVIRLDDINELLNIEKLTALSILINRGNYFANGININYYYQLDNNTIQLITYERDCGFTLACGTGACASAVAFIEQQLYSQNNSLHINIDNTKNIIANNHNFHQDSKIHTIKVIAAIDELTIQYNNYNSHIYMIGDATSIFSGKLY